MGDGERAKLHLECDQAIDGRLDRLPNGPGALIRLHAGGDLTQDPQKEGASAHGGIGQRHVG